MKKIFLLFLLVFMISFISASEQYITGTDQGPASIGNLTWRGQTFQVTNGSFYATSIEALFNSTTLAGTNITVIIQNVTQATGVPNGQNLTIGSAIANFDSTLTFRRIKITPVLLIQGRNYSISFLTNQTSTVSGPYSNSTAPGGYRYGNFTQSNDAGSSWTINDFDMAFKVNGEGPTLISPSNNTIQSDQFVDFLWNSTGTTLVNETLYVWNDTAVYASNFDTITGSSNSTSITLGLFDLGNYKWNVNVCSTTSCNFQADNFTFTIGASNLSDYVYNSSTYETSLESYSLNVSIPSALTISSSYLWYNGTAYSSTVTNVAGNNYTLSRSLDIPTGISLKNLFFQTILSNGFSQNFTTKTQSISALNLTLCGAAPQNIPFINFTFKNESSSAQSISAAISSTWNYWLGSGNVNKSFSFSNTTENPSYAFCSNPINRTLIVSNSLTYSNSVSTQRSFALSSSSLTNVTTNYTLYLLSSALGIYSRYATQTVLGSPLSGVLGVVTTSIGGNSVNIGSGYSDSSGLLVFFLNPESSYNYIFTKSGYQDNSFTLTPNSLETYSVVMAQTGAGGTQIVNGSTIGNNLSIIITPSNSSLLNNTIYSFGLNATGVGLTFISLNITNSSGQQVGYTSGVSGLISININTGNTSSYFIGTYIIQTATERSTFTRTWGVNNYFTGTYSLFAVMTSWPLYGFVYDYYRIFIVLITLVVAIGGISAIESIDTSESKIGMGIFIIWAFSYVGWLTMNITVIDPANSFYILNQYANQYGIAILSTVGGLAALRGWLS